MVCIYCGADTKVSNSRLQKRNNQIWRRRQCLGCQAIFTSHEAIDLSSGLLVGLEAPKAFNEDLLYSDLLMALKDRKDAYTAAREACYTVIQQLLKLPQKPQFTTTDISRVCAVVLKRLDQPAYHRFYADHPSLQQ